MTRFDLPIDVRLGEIVELVQSNPVTLLEAEPGAGKTTRVPPALLAAKLTKILVLEPRRLAARMAAERVAYELGEPIGGLVGYQVRFEDRTTPGTQLSFVTEGVLTRRLLRDPKLQGVRVAILDEFHERHLETDLALALLRSLQAERSDLRILIMSATLESDLLQKTFPNAPLLSASGKSHAVDVRYTPYSPVPLEEQVATALQKTLPAGSGHALVLLPGASEIRRAIETSQSIVRQAGALALPLHGSLSPGEQDRALAPSDIRKVIFSTNVAESSLTIDGVRLVIDSGLARVASWSPWSGIGRLKIEKISRASAIQRAGRAGRTASGIAVRLFPEEDYRRRPEQTEPEILRADLTELLLQVSVMGLKIGNLAWINAPLPESLAHAQEVLSRLGALDEQGMVTAAGRRMSHFAMHPRLARFLIQAAETGVSQEAARLAALLSEGRFRLNDAAAHRHASDVEALLAADLSSNARRIEQQIVRSLPRQRPSVDEHGLERALLLAFPDRVGRRNGETLLLSNGSSARLDRASATRSDFVCALEVEERAEQGSALVRIASPIEPDWLLDFFPQRIRTVETLVWDRLAERVEEVSSLRYDELVIDESRQQPRDFEAASALLVQKALDVGLEAFTDAASLNRLLARIHFLRQYSPTAVPSHEDLLAQAVRKLASGLRSFAELRLATRDGVLESALESLLPTGLLNEVAPAAVRLPSGRRARIEYSEHQPPWVASRLQDFFGMKETPRVARGAVSVVVRLLAPNQRPVQVTEDLASFWKNLYPQIRRELSRRYPRHKWPEDPFTASD